VSRAAAVRTAARRRVRVDAARRLKLAEALLGADTAAACARQALAWLRESLGVQRGLCLFGPAESATVLMPMAAVGVPERRTAGFALDLEARNHPLVIATLGTTPVAFGTNGQPAPSTPLESYRYTAVPLHGRDSAYDLPVGLLLVTPVAADAHGDVACLLMEPALTNIGIVLPEDGFLEAVRDACTRAGTLLIIDETHTLCAGPGGYTRAHGLDPDLLTVGKAIGSGIPSAAYGFSADVAARVEASMGREESDVGGVGGTLAANVLSLAAVRATLEHVLTEEAFARMIALGERFDVVLFMGVLYHLRHPLLALDLLYEHAVGDLLVFQSMQRGTDAVLPLAEDYPFDERSIFDTPGFPALYFVERKYSADWTNWWIPNRAAVEAMLRSAGFEIESHPEDEVYICRRGERPTSVGAVYPAQKGSPRD